MPDRLPHILILIDWYLPGYRAGGPIQSTSNLVRVMEGRYTFGVMTMNVDHDSHTPYPDITPDSWTTRPEGYPVYYFSRENLSYRKLKTLIEESHADFVYMNSMYSWPFTIWPLLMFGRKRQAFKMVLAPRGMLQAGAVRIKGGKKQLFLRLVRMLGLHRHLIWHATDAQEKEDVQRFFGPKADARVASNIPKQDQLPWQSPPKVPGTLHCVFHSRLSKKKNLAFFLERLKAVQADLLTLDVYGPQEDAAYLATCQAVAAQLPAHVMVTFKGAVPAPELPERLKPYHVSILTTVAENFGHSIFEGLLAGKPVLISDRTPWRNLASRNLGWDLPLEDPAAFEAALQQAIDMDQETYDRWSQAAWAYAGTYRRDPGLIAQTMAVFE